MYLYLIQIDDYQRLDIVCSHQAIKLNQPKEYLTKHDLILEGTPESHQAKWQLIMQLNPGLVHYASLHTFLSSSNGELQNSIPTCCPSCVVELYRLFPLQNLVV